MPKSLAIAGFFRKHQMTGGVASVFQNLLRGIEELVQNDEQYRDLRVGVFHGQEGTPYHSPLFQYIETSSAGGRFVAESRVAAFRSGAFDAMLCHNYFTPPVVRAGRVVTVVHDLLHLHFPEAVTSSKKLWLMGAHRWSLLRANTVVTITQAVKDDVVQQYGSRWAHRIKPIWNPVAFDRLDGQLVQDFTNGRPYILGVAVDRPLKNLGTLVRAFELIRNRHPEFCLVLAGELRSRRPAQEQMTSGIGEKLPAAGELVKSLGLQNDVKTTGFVSDEQLGALYRGATAFVLPSLFEGFGMPPVEAIACGTPALISDIPPLREITMGQAFYLSDPLDPEQIAEQTISIIDQGSAARPTRATIELFRQSFAPSTIARKYLETLLDSQ
jgi:glycosyltransferase involved in cell wall biosynthesis